MKTNLESRIASLDMEDYIFQASADEEVTDTELQAAAGSAKVSATSWSEDVNDESWFAVRKRPA